MMDQFFYVYFCLLMIKILKAHVILVFFLMKCILFIPRNNQNPCIKQSYFIFTFVRYIPNIVSKDIFIPECTNGYYGNDCINHCSGNCDLTSRCEKSTGQCDDGCIPGWRGIICNQSKCFTSYLMVCIIFFFLYILSSVFVILLGYLLW